MEYRFHGVSTFLGVGVMTALVVVSLVRGNTLYWNGKYVTPFMAFDNIV
jgi:hypothetical protein